MKANAIAIVEHYLDDISAIHATRANVAETSEEVRYVTEIARRIAALIGSQPNLDASCRAVGDANDKRP